MTELPTGRVTFLLADVESSTVLLQEEPDAYPEIIAAVRRILRGAVTAHEGSEVDATGDALLAAFG